MRQPRGTGIDPNLLEGIVFVESAGRPDVIAGADPSAAAGPDPDPRRDRSVAARACTSTSPQSRKLLTRIGNAVVTGPGKAAAAPAREGRRALRPPQGAGRDGPLPRAGAAPVRPRRTSRSSPTTWGSATCRTCSRDYDGGRPVPYAQLYFDTSPDHHGSAFDLLAGFGDQSSLYYWRVLGAAQIMRLYRTDRERARRLARLQNAAGTTAEVLHPPDRTPQFADPSALSSAYAQRELVPLPANGRAPRARIRTVDGIATRERLGAPAALYRGLRPAALDLLVELAARVRALAGTSAPLIVASTVMDTRYQQRLGSRRSRRPRPATRSRSRAATRAVVRRTRSRRCSTGCNR